MIMLTNIQTMAKLRSDFGLKIGSSTGYTSEIMAKLRLVPYFIICDSCVFSKKNVTKYIMLRLGHSVVCKLQNQATSGRRGLRAGQLCNQVQKQV